MGRYPDETTARFDQQFRESESERNERLRKSRISERQELKKADQLNAQQADLPEGDMDATAPDLCDRGMEALAIADLLRGIGRSLGDCYAYGMPTKALAIRWALEYLRAARVRIDALVAALEGEL